MKKIVFRKLDNIRQHVLLDIENDKEINTSSLVFDILKGDKIYIDLNGIETENDLLNLLYNELCKIDKIKEILKFYSISKDKFGFMDFDNISDELEIAELKIVFNNIDRISLEIQEILNSLISIRERKIIYILMGKLKDYRFYTGIEGINIREGDDYIVL